MKIMAFFLLLLPIILAGTLACGGGETESTTFAAPTQTAEGSATEAPEPTTADPAPATVAPTEPAPTAEPTATIASTEPTEPADPTEAPPDTPTPMPTDTPEPEPLAVPVSFVVAEGSQITFTVEEELNRSPVRFDAVISGTGLTGFAHLDGSPSVITLDLLSLESDQRFRDRYMRNEMFPNTPEATVTFNQLPDLPESFLEGEETEGKLEGSLQIGDTITPLTFDVIARLDPGVINVLGRTTFTWEELGLDKPIFGPVAYLAEEVRVQVLIVAQGE